MKSLKLRNRELIYHIEFTELFVDNIPCYINSDDYEAIKRDIILIQQSSIGWQKFILATSQDLIHISNHLIEVKDIWHLK